MIYKLGSGASAFIYDLVYIRVSGHFVRLKVPIDIFRVRDSLESVFSKQGDLRILRVAYVLL